MVDQRGGAQLAASSPRLGATALASRPARHGAAAAAWQAWLLAAPSQSAQPYCRSTAELQGRVGVCVGEEDAEGAGVDARKD